MWIDAKADSRSKQTHLFGVESKENRCLEDTYDIDGKAIKAVPKKSIKPAKPDFAVVNDQVVSAITGKSGTAER